MNREEYKIALDKVEKYEKLQNTKSKLTKILATLATGEPVVSNIGSNYAQSNIIVSKEFGEITHKALTRLYKGLLEETIKKMEEL